MILYLVRHGRAEPPRPGTRDEDRSLTDRGRREVREAMARARSAAPARILTSPLLRARQTAEIAAEALRCPEPPVPTAALTPDSSPERVWAELAGHRAAGEIMLVGHQPLLGNLYAFLLAAPALAVAVEPGSIGRIELDGVDGQPSAALHWLLPPA
jgi:phosphohistidine phosphatase